MVIASKINGAAVRRCDNDIMLITGSTTCGEDVTRQRKRDSKPYFGYNKRDDRFRARIGVSATATGFLRSIRPDFGQYKDDIKRKNISSLVLLLHGGLTKEEVVQFEGGPCVASGSNLCR